VPPGRRAEPAAVDRGAVVAAANRASQPAAMAQMALPALLLPRLAIDTSHMPAVSALYSSVALVASEERHTRRRATMPQPDFSPPHAPP
jgi:hypothetical protein